MLSSWKVANLAQNISLTVTSGADFPELFRILFHEICRLPKRIVFRERLCYYKFKKQVQWDDQIYLSKGKIAVLCAGIKKEKIQARLWRYECAIGASLAWDKWRNFDLAATSRELWPHACRRILHRKAKWRLSSIGQAVGVGHGDPKYTHLRSGSYM